MPKQTKDNPIAQKSLLFAVKIVKLVNKMPKTPAGFAIGGQLVRSGTSIGANTQEAQRARSKRDFKNCLHIALKEAVETRYWLFVSEKSGLIDESKINIELEEIIKILSSIIKKLTN
ncbi:MAG: hypothetical protein BWY43_00576 [candidate division WS2 bacterium ADurb.Bin280]|uniref:Four helix bundle protein n=1 Tax=candidate division WS2 bacterium ADurb.Bin280 TaxID=1852829 RepID=A0A1V5SDE2_9BACT|nr:MAG: hypothetical protein BWY43_00576 [candidate division WS2 bacterium ADurb.Bin280]